MKKKIYCFNNGGSPGWYEALALAEDGHIVGNHICSHPCYIPGDLGIEEDWSGKHENYNRHYGEGNWELELVENPKAHPGLLDAFAKNQELARAAKESSSSTP